MKQVKWIYWISTGVLTVIVLMSVGMYLFNYAHVSEVFESLGYPKYVIYPLAAAKILGLLPVWLKVSMKLQEWAYAGFFFDFVLALSAHIVAGDGDFAIALIALVLLLTSYISNWLRNIDFDDI